MNPPRPAFFRPARWPAFLALLPAPAWAHPGHYHPPGEEDEFDSLTAGFMHPLGGPDHLLLALAVGWLAFAWLGGKSRLASLSAFLVALGGGALIGRGIQAAAGLEIAISLTLVVAGLAFMIGKNPHSAAFLGALAAAGITHGYAHGVEAATTVHFPLYAVGFLAGTSLLLLTGAMLHVSATRIRQPLIPRAAGLVLLCIGVVSLSQAL